MVLTSMDVSYIEDRSAKVCAAYKVASEVHKKLLDSDEGVARLAKILGNENSARSIVTYIFPKLLKGEKITWVLSDYYYPFFLEAIFKEYGYVAVQNAIKTAKLNFQYRNRKTPARLTSLFHQYSNISHSEPQAENEEQKVEDIIEQYQYIKSLPKKMSKEELKRILDETIGEPPTTIDFKGRLLKRNNKIIALIKELRGHQCQICDASINMKNGLKYVEAAHITPKRGFGAEIPSNIVLLCPNHHKQFDLGFRKDIERTNQKLVTMLEQKTYTIFL